MRNYGRRKTNFRKYRPRAVRRTYTRRTPLRYAKGKVKPSYRILRTLKAVNAFRECKTLKTSINIPFDILGLGYSFPNVPQGDDRVSRDGNKIFVRYMLIKGYIRGSNLPVPPTNNYLGVIRHSGVWPKPKTGQQLPVLSSTVAPIDEEQYVRLWDKLMPVGGTNQSTTSNEFINTGLSWIKPVNLRIKVMKSFNYMNGSMQPQDTTPYFFFMSDAIPSDPSTSKPWLVATIYFTFNDV